MIGGFCKANLAEDRILKAHRRRNICRLICTKHEKRESTAEESTDSEGNRKFNLYENTVKGKPLERVGRKAMGPKAHSLSNIVPTRF